MGAMLAQMRSTGDKPRKYPYSIMSGTVELPQLPAGVYAVKIGSEGSTLIRL